MQPVRPTLPPTARRRAGTRWSALAVVTFVILAVAFAPTTLAAKPVRPTPTPTATPAPTEVPTEVPTDPGTGGEPAPEQPDGSGGVPPDQDG